MSRWRKAVLILAILVLAIALSVRGNVVEMIITKKI